MLKMGQLRRKNNQQTLGQAIKEFIDKNGFQKKINETKIIMELDKILGPTLSKYIDNVYIRNKKLHIYLKSSVLRQEFSYQKSELVKELNDLVGEEVITDLILN